MGFFPRWTLQEDEVLRTQYAVASWGALLDLLPGRAKQSIVQRAMQIGAVRAKSRPVTQVDGVDGKTCRTCTTWKPLVDFYNRRNSAGNKSTQCSACSEKRRGSWNEKNKDRAFARSSAWQKKNPDRAAAAYRRYYVNHADRARAASASWRKRNPDRVRETDRRWRIDNPEKYQEMRRRWRKTDRGRASKAAGRKTRRGKMLGTVRARDLVALTQYFGGRCGFCLTAKANTFDHMKAIACGGEHAAVNLVPACRDCNTQKGTHSLLAFLALSNGKG